MIDGAGDSGIKVETAQTGTPGVAISDRYIEHGSCGSSDLFGGDGYSGVFGFRKRVNIGSCHLGPAGDDAFRQTVVCGIIRDAYIVVLEPQGDFGCEGFIVLHLQYPQDQIQLVGTCTNSGRIVVNGLQNEAAPEDLVGNITALYGDGFVVAIFCGTQPEHIASVKHDLVCITFNDELKIQAALTNTTAIIIRHFLAQAGIEQEMVGYGVKGADDVVKGVCIIASFVVRIKGLRAGTDQLSGDGCGVHTLGNTFIGFHPKIADIGKIPGQIIPDGTLVIAPGGGQFYVGAVRCLCCIGSIGGFRGFGRLGGLGRFRSFCYLGSICGLGCVSCFGGIGRIGCVSCLGRICGIGCICSLGSICSIRGFGNTGGLRRVSRFTFDAPGRGPQAYSNAE